MDLNTYLQRVNLTNCAPPSLSALRELHCHHVHSVPTESLSIHSGEKIILDIPWIYDKIVVRRRGGFCFENNSLFFWVLQQLGYQPRILSARVRNHIIKIFGPPFDHMILTVELEGRRWLCDVGFGEGITDPFPLESGWEEEQDSGVYRLRVEEDEWYLERKEEEETWRSLYKFTLKERKIEDFLEMCEYHQTSPSSIFVQKSFCSLQLQCARLTYMGHRLISTKYIKGGGSVKTTREVAEVEIPGLLRDKFGIVLSGKLVPKDEEIVIPNRPQSNFSKPDLNTYLRRVGITEFSASSTQPSLSILRALHRHHVLSVPFESLSIHSGEKILPNIYWIYDKIVLRKRGGFCYENNGLFLWVLQELGYQPGVLSGRVKDEVTGVYGPQFDHLILTAEVDGRRWLCDVGFGDGIIEPVPLEAGWEEEQDSGVFRLRVEDVEWYMQRKEDNVWKSLYKFTLKERTYEDFKEMCEYHQTKPNSFFVKKAFCTQQLPTGRLTYMGYRLINTKYTKEGGSVKTTQELTEEEIPDVLRDKFGIVLSGKLIPKDD